MKELIVLAIGGNSLIADPHKIDIDSQYQACLETCEHIAALLKGGYRVMISHGNGPQVGFILRRSELASHELHRVPLGVCVADTQGSIGYMIQRALYKHMHNWPEHPQVVTIVTQVLVDENDPAFEVPSKPIGSFMDEATAKSRQEQFDWKVVEDAGRGFRRVVPSPMPKEIVEGEAIAHLVEYGYVVVAVGGGGIPVVKRDDGSLFGVDAVIDKDRASSLMATQLKADCLLISTAVEKVYLHFGKPEQRALDQITVSQAREYLAQGHFGKGSMEPKMEAAVEFLENGGKSAVITNPPNLQRAMAGETGTRIVPD